MIYSKTCEYGIRAMMYFTDFPEKESATVKEVSGHTAVPAAYVSKIFQCLVKSRLLHSRRGPHGGYSLALAPSRVTLLRLMNALDDASQSPLTHCVMGLDKCDDKNPCPLHPIWSEAKEKMLFRLAKTSIEDIATLGRKFWPAKHRRVMLSKHMRSLFAV